MSEMELQVIEDFVGSVLLFSSALRRVVEESALRETVGGELTESQLKVLRLLNLSRSHTLGDVAAFLGVSNAAASKAVDKLVSRMLLRRTEGEADRRSIRLTLTEPARRMLAAYEAAVRSKLNEIFAGFPPEQLRDLAGKLNRYTDRIVSGGSEKSAVCLQCGMYFPARCVRRDAGGTCEYLDRKERRAGE